MSPTDIITHRLVNQQIAGTNFSKPEEMVGWLGAVQAQEYAMSKWAIGLRMAGLKDADVEKAFNEGKILRTHVLRPTWHFVTREDIRWVLHLSAPRVHAVNAYYYRQAELDKKVFKKCNDVLVRALEGGKFLTRTDLQAVLAKSKIVAEGMRLGALMMQAELDGIICSGPRQGKQFTYALIAERAPGTKILPREEALARLTFQYFRSRGPAMVQDYAWWSGLTVKEIMEGVHSLGKEIVQIKINGQEYFMAADRQELPVINKRTSQATFLMPDYDEYGISYKNRSAILPTKSTAAKPAAKPNFVYNRMIVADGRIIGAWKPIQDKKSLNVDTVFFQPLRKTQQAAVTKAIQRYIEFSR